MPMPAPIPDERRDDAMTNAKVHARVGPLFQQRKPGASRTIAAAGFGESKHYPECAGSRIWRIAKPPAHCRSNR